MIAGQCSLGRKVRLSQAVVSEIGPEGPVGNGNHPEVGTRQLRSGGLLEGCLQWGRGWGWEGANQAEEEGSMVYEKATVKRPFLWGVGEGLTVVTHPAKAHPYVYVCNHVHPAISISKTIMSLPAMWKPGFAV